MTDDSGSGSGRSDTGESIIERLGSSRRTFLKGTSAIAGGAALGSTAAGEESESNGESKSDGGTNDDENSGPTNVVMYVGDGQGVTHLSLGRYLKAYQEDPEAFPLNVSEVGYNFDRFEAEGLTTTHPDDPNEFVTDSAAAGTAFSSGVKTYNGAIGGYAENGEFVETTTVLEAAREMGYATGLVTTARMTHATPACFAAHVPDRNEEAAIAAQYLENANVDVLFGGGRQYFLPEGREDGENLVQAFEEEGYAYAETASGLDAIDSAPALGLFAEESHMNYVLDRMDGESDQPGLPEMAEKALQLLEAESDGEGIFLMVEAARIDHASHANDFAVAYEQTEADDTVGTVLDYADGLDNETLALGTADHECGALSLGYGGPYNMNFDVLAGVAASGEAMETAVSGVEPDTLGGDGRDRIEELLRQYGDIEPTDSELDEAMYGYAVPPKEIINERIRLGWNSVGHTGAEIVSFAQGPNSEAVDSSHDNTDLADVVFRTLGTENQNT